MAQRLKEIHNKHARNQLDSADIQYLVGEVVDLRKAYVMLLSGKQTRCPRCGGDADNGIDRNLPPNPYVCSECSNVALQRSDAELVKAIRAAAQAIIDYSNYGNVDSYVDWDQYYDVLSDALAAYTRGRDGT